MSVAMTMVNHRTASSLVQLRSTTSYVSLRGARRPATDNLIHPTGSEMSVTANIYLVPRDALFLLLVD